MVKGKTKSGIEFSMNEQVVNDARVLYYLTAMQKLDADSQTLEASNQVFELLNLIFGSQDGVIAFMNAVANANDGVCDVGTMLKELTDMFDAIGAKKS